MSASVNTVPFQDDTLSATANQTAASRLPIAWSSVLEELPAYVTLSSDAQMKVFRDLVKGLLAHPEKVEEIAQKLKENLKNPLLANLFIGALAASGSPEAQNALTHLCQELAQNSDSKPTVHTIINALNTSNAPMTAETKAYLGNLVSSKSSDAELATNAAFALGSGLQKGADAASEQKLADFMAHTQTSAEKLAGIDAIGNSGDKNLLPSLEPSLASADAAIRERATYALRFMQDSQAQTLLQKAFTDAEPQVQAAAARAVLFQKNQQVYVASLQTCQSSSTATVSAICRQALVTIQK